MKKMTKKERDDLVAITYVGQMLDELIKAEKKHPYFADYIAMPHSEKWDDILCTQRRRLEAEIRKRDVSTYTVTLCELFEFMDACAQEDWKAAMVELAQVGAVLIRTARMVQAKIDDQDGGGA